MGGAIAPIDLITRPPIDSTHPMPIQFGVFDHLDRNDLPLQDYYEARLQTIEAYERGGFFAYHLAEHHATPLGMAPSPTVFLAAVAQRTRRLRFGPMVYALPLYHPLRLIEEICMLDQMSRGRLELGFGRGASPIEIEYFGVDPAEAEQIYDDTMAMIRRALTESKLTFHGAHHRFDNVPIALEPLQRPMPPLWYGMHALESAERAARNRQRVISLDPHDLACALVQRYRETWRATHGDEAWPLMGLGRFIVVAPTDAEALALARPAYLRWHESFMYLFHLHRRTLRHARPPTFDELIERGQGVAGSPATVAAFLQNQIRASGANYLVGQFAFGHLGQAETLRSIEMFVAQVMPALRGLG